MSFLSDIIPMAVKIGQAIFKAITSAETTPAEIHNKENYAVSLALQAITDQGLFDQLKQNFTDAQIAMILRILINSTVGIFNSEIGSDWVSAFDDIKTNPMVKFIEGNKHISS